MRRLTIVLVLVAMSMTVPVATAACSTSTSTESAGTVSVTQTHTDCLSVYSDPSGVSQVSTSDTDTVVVKESTSASTVSVARAQYDSMHSSPSSLQESQTNYYQASASSGGSVASVYLASQRYTNNGACTEYVYGSGGAYVRGIYIGTGTSGWPAGAPCLPAQVHDLLP